MTANNQGQSKGFYFRINPMLIEALDDYSQTQGINRSEALRRAIVALTGVNIAITRKQRNDIGKPRTLKDCPVHADAFNKCLSHDSTCDDTSCACLIHIKD